MSSMSTTDLVHIATNDSSFKEGKQAKKLPLKRRQRKQLDLIRSFFYHQTVVVEGGSLTAEARYLPSAQDNQLQSINKEEIENTDQNLQKRQPEVAATAVKTHHEDLNASQTETTAAVATMASPWKELMQYTTDTYSSYDQDQDSSNHQLPSILPQKYYQKLLDDSRKTIKQQIQRMADFEDQQQPKPQPKPKQQHRFNSTIPPGVLFPAPSPGASPPSLRSRNERTPNNSAQRVQQQQQRHQQVPAQQVENPKFSSILSTEAQKLMMRQALSVAAANSGSVTYSPPSTTRKNPPATPLRLSPTTVDKPAPCTTKIPQRTTSKDAPRHVKENLSLPDHRSQKPTKDQGQSNQIIDYQSATGKTPLLLAKARFKKAARPKAKANKPRGRPPTRTKHLLPPSYRTSDDSNVRRTMTPPLPPLPVFNFGNVMQRPPATTPYGNPNVKYEQAKPNYFNRTKNGGSNPPSSTQAEANEPATTTKIAVNKIQSLANGTTIGTSASVMPTRMPPPKVPNLLPEVLATAKGTETSKTSITTEKNDILLQKVTNPLATMDVESMAPTLVATNMIRSRDLHAKSHDITLPATELKQEAGQANWVPAERTSAVLQPVALGKNVGSHRITDASETKQTATSSESSAPELAPPKPFPGIAVPLQKIEGHSIAVSQASTKEDFSMRVAIAPSTTIAIPKPSAVHTFPRHKRISKTRSNDLLLTTKTSTFSSLTGLGERSLTASTDALFQSDCQDECPTTGVDSMTAETAVKLAKPLPIAAVDGAHGQGGQLPKAVLPVKMLPSFLTPQNKLQDQVNAESDLQHLTSYAFVDQIKQPDHGSPADLKPKWSPTTGESDAEVGTGNDNDCPPPHFSPVKEYMASGSLVDILPPEPQKTLQYLSRQLPLIQHSHIPSARMLQDASSQEPQHESKSLLSSEDEPNYGVPSMSEHRSAGFPEGTKARSITDTAPSDMSGLIPLQEQGVESSKGSSNVTGLDRSSSRQDFLESSEIKLPSSGIANKGRASSLPIRQDQITAPLVLPPKGDYKTAADGKNSESRALTPVAESMDQSSQSPPSLETITAGTSETTIAAMAQLEESSNDMAHLNPGIKAIANVSDSKPQTSACSSDHIESSLSAHHDPEQMTETMGIATTRESAEVSGPPGSQSSSTSTHYSPDLAGTTTTTSTTLPEIEATTTVNNGTATAVTNAISALQIDPLDNPEAETMSLSDTALATSQRSGAPRFKKIPRSNRVSEKALIPASSKAITADSVMSSDFSISSTMPSLSLSRKRKSTSVALPCHSCKKKTFEFRHCSYWVWSKCGKRFCRDCLENEYGQTEDWQSLKSDKDWHCPSCLKTCKCGPCVKLRSRESLEPLRKSRREKTHL